MLTEETADLVRSTYNMKNSYVRKVKDIAVKNIVMSLENSTIGFMCNALKPLFSAMIRQYKVGKYRVDLYIPDIDLCVECDERGHLEYNAVEEAARQAYVEKELACRFLRFNPNAIDFDLSDVISDILDVYWTSARRTSACGTRQRQRRPKMAAELPQRL
jgi:very-short-patch-repair endonuclease